jgi:hypothetical protein
MNKMMTWATPAIVLGPTDNLQGSYKFYNLITGKKITRHMSMPYLMPNSVIKKVETFGAGKQDGFDFADCNGALFEWNGHVNALKGKGLVEEDVILYPFITAEFLGVALTMCHITPIEEEFDHTAASRMPLPATTILDRSLSQEWVHAQYMPTQTRSMTLATTMITT